MSHNDITVSNMSTTYPGVDYLLYVALLRRPVLLGKPVRHCFIAMLLIYYEFTRLMRSKVVPIFQYPNSETEAHSSDAFVCVVCLSMQSLPAFVVEDYLISVSSSSFVFCNATRVISSHCSAT